MNANVLLLGTLLATTTGGPRPPTPVREPDMAVDKKKEASPDDVASGGGVTTDPDLVTKGFVILETTASYADARAAAAAAAETLAIRMDLRQLAPDRTIGLTFPEAACVDEFGSFPCYVPRGRWDDGVYLSVEHTGSYPGFDENRYIVVLASGAPHDRALRAALRRAQSAYPTAFIKTIPVYLGCLH
jgi:hypothetical protein